MNENIVEKVVSFASSRKQFYDQLKALPQNGYGIKESEVNSVLANYKDGELFIDSLTFDGYLKFYYPNDSYIGYYQLKNKQDA